MQILAGCQPTHFRSRVIAHVLLAGVVAVLEAAGIVVAARAQTEIAKSHGPLPADPAVAEVPKSRPKVAVPDVVAPEVRPIAVEGPAVATAASLHGGATAAGPRFVFALSLSKPVDASVFVLANPSRVVIDVPHLDFALPPGVGRSHGHAGWEFRYGVFSAGRSRIVIEAAWAARIARTQMVPATATSPASLQVTIEPATGGVVAAPATPPVAATAPAKPFVERKVQGRFVVMIDPGHGGIDGGAMSQTHVVEKDIVLQVAHHLKAALDGRHGYDVRMTRVGDTFVSLDRRVEVSQAAGADLFISIHADSVGDAAVARTARGATVYTLSETASNEAARQLAEKENAADAAGGLDGAEAGDEGQVNSILADLVKRETQNFSHEFRSLLIDRLRPTQMLGRDPSRAAAFKVLRQVQTPTALVELGFLTHEMDAQQMQTAAWQKRIAVAIAAAIDTYAGRRLAAARP